MVFLSQRANFRFTVHSSLFTIHFFLFTNYQVFRIGCASVLKIVCLKSSVSGGAKRR